MLKPERPDLSSERGVAMIVVLLALIAGSMISAVALGAATGDLPFARDSQDRKQAYAAAEAGLEYYLFQLSQDNDYWTRCTNVPAPSPTEQSPVNQAWDGRGADPRRWRRVPGSTAEYTIELLPAAGSAACVQGQANATFLDRSTGTFRVRASGRANGITRSIVTTMRRSSFLDYIYFTDLETQNPLVYPTATQRSRAQTNCVQPRAGRDAIRQSTFNCEEIHFAPGDGIHGPIHTNDNILICGSPTFGREAGTGETQRPPGSPPDAIEVSGPGAFRNRAQNGCGGEADVLGTLANPVDTLTLPTGNAGLEQVAQPEYRYTGTTRITLRGNVMDVTNSANQTFTNVPLPANGVIYVRNGACTGTETPLLADYQESAGCANVYVSGSYAQSLTIASANDIIVTGNVRRSGDVVLGLIANSFVRVQHRVENRSGVESCTNSSPVLRDLRIDAAILTLANSFLVDSFRCGAHMGTLTVHGAIAQRFRGPVGTSRPTGYTKRYIYDDRLKYRSPPFFLDPVAAAWKVARANEQVPAVAERTP